MGSCCPGGSVGPRLPGLVAKLVSWGRGDFHWLGRVAKRAGSGRDPDPSPTPAHPPPWPASPVHRLKGEATRPLPPGVRSSVADGQ